jgi:hypothetical protein
VVKVPTGAAAHSDYLRVPTSGGAGAVGCDLGRISPSAQAGMIEMRLEGLRAGVANDPVPTAIQHGCAWAVDSFNDRSPDRRPLRTERCVA